MADRFITLAIHTYPYALTLKKILGSHGIDVFFEKLVITGAGIPSGVRVKIKDTDLPLALKLTESDGVFPSAKVEMNMSGTHGNILIPVDFSKNSFLACRAGFELARRMELHPVILHAYATPYFNGDLALEDTFDPAMTPLPDGGVMEAEEEIDLQKESVKLMKAFRGQLDSELREEGLGGIDYSVSMVEGIPEEAILEYCRLTPPALVVMATRGKEKKGEQLIGSVTAEVLDSCRVPVFTIPDNFDFTSVDSIRKLVYFCNLDQHDIISVDTLMRIFDFPSVEVTLVPVNDRAGERIREKVEMLCDYFNKNYPAATFSATVFSPKTFREELEKFDRGTGVQLLIVPNRKKNIFSRIFNPGIAHKLLFELDTPLLALPV